VNKQVCPLILFSDPTSPEPAMQHTLTAGMDLPCAPHWEETDKDASDVDSSHAIAGDGNSG